MEEVRVSAGSGESAYERILEHIAGKTGVLADDNACGSIVALAAPEFSVIPADKASYFERMVSSEVLVCSASESVCTKILTHNMSP